MVARRDSVVLARATPGVELDIVGYGKIFMTQSRRPNCGICVMDVRNLDVCSRPHISLGSVNPSGPPRQPQSEICF
jgi:hypothetical protein